MQQLQPVLSAGPPAARGGTHRNRPAQRQPSLAAEQHQQPQGDSHRHHQTQPYECPEGDRARTGRDPTRRRPRSPSGWPQRMPIRPLRERILTTTSWCSQEDSTQFRKRNRSGPTEEIRAGYSAPTRLPVALIRCEGCGTPCFRAPGPGFFRPSSPCSRLQTHIRRRASSAGRLRATGPRTLLSDSRRRDGDGSVKIDTWSDGENGRDSHGVEPPWQ